MDIAGTHTHRVDKDAFDKVDKAAAVYLFLDCLFELLALFFLIGVGSGAISGSSDRN